MTCFVTSPAEGRCFDEPSDFNATAAQCENVAPVIDCEPMHATICSGAGSSGPVEAGGAPADGIGEGGEGGGGQPPVGA